MRRTLSIGAVAVVVGLMWLGGREVAAPLVIAIGHVREQGAAGPIVFIALYAAAILALVPSTVLTVIGGAIFGLARGVVFALAGAIIGSVGAFLIGRHGARRLVARRLASMPRFQAIDRAVSERGWHLVLLLRLSPVAPFNFLNYALGLTTIPVRDFALASIGMVPGAIVYAYGGKVAGEALALAGQAQVPHDASYYLVLTAGLAATVVATWFVTRTARRALRDV